MTNNEKIINDLRLDRENLLLLISNLQSNWNSLREWLEEDLRQVYRDAGYRNNIIREILDKMNELEGKDKK